MFGMKRRRCDGKHTFEQPRDVAIDDSDLHVSPGDSSVALSDRVLDEIY